MTPSAKIKKLKEMHVAERCNDQKLRCKECRQLAPCSTEVVVSAK